MQWICFAASERLRKPLMANVGPLIMDEFLCSEDKTILRETLEEFGVSPKEFWRFWSWDELQLDGDFRLLELQALAKAMERIAERHAAQHPRAGDGSPQGFIKIKI